MKKLLQCGCVLLLLALWPSAAGGQQPSVRCTPERGGNGCAFAARVWGALEKLDLGCKGWTIVILSDAEWKQMQFALLVKGRALHTDRAFTLRTARYTYLRESVFTARPDKALLEDLAHEFAHLRVCAANESCAKETAARIAKLIASEEKP